jgi:hypothetical protein
MSNLDTLKSGYSSLRAGTIYQTWARANTNEADKLDKYVQSLIAGGSFAMPSMATATGVGLVKWASMAAPITPPPPTTEFVPRASWYNWSVNTTDATVALIRPDSQKLIDHWIADGNIRYPNLILGGGYATAWTIGDLTKDPAYAISRSQPTWANPLDSKVPIPKGTKPPGNGDGHLVIFEPGRNLVHEMFQARYDSTTDKWSSTSACSYPIGERPVSGGTNATGVPQLAFAIWAEEIAEDNIPHALGFSTGGVPFGKASPSFVYPAKGSDGKGDSQDLPEGSRLALPLNALLDNAWPKWVKTVHRALIKHGMVLMDQGGTLGIAGVNPINGGMSWSAAGVTSGGFPANFPWKSMHVLVP